MDRHTFINLFHVLVIAPLLFYIYAKRQDLSDTSCTIMLGVCTILFAYFMVKFFSSNKRGWIYMIHLVLVLPLLFMLSMYCKSAKRMYFELLLMLTFAAVGYHGFYLVSS